MLRSREEETEITKLTTTQPCCVPYACVLAWVVQARHLLGHARRKFIFHCPWIGYLLPWVCFIHVSVLRAASNKKRSEGEDETGEREDVQYEEHQVVACKIQTRCLTEVRNNSQ